ncbi:TonB-linked SusC/RagA family outer membrane protein [Catalinimonas alkaloidigena]|uniref:SusC/RagA family TonB-linked outer membrane protein n=1 Tax=Catalinimonas alkaloidigena TaxID=1075417 RepID=UPI002406F67B|nr:TonB-dependent receptor [Catalinimonas alkaloidigena]MDF9796343.1 TonB-linked SusC/RagA family outer membrane protein [Catalinimonas alkaloidigena]
MRYFVRHFRKILLLIVVTCVQLSVSAQEIVALKSSVDEKTPTNLLESRQDSKSLASMLNELEIKYKVHFNYASELVSNRLVNPTNKVNEPTNLDELLDLLLTPLGLQYEKIEKDLYLIFEEKNEVPSKLQNKTARDDEQNLSLLKLMDKLVSSRYVSLLSLEQTITGKVTDGENGDALPGVNVLAKGTTNGTVTDIDGSYRLTVADEVSTLLFSSIGYVTEEIEINGQNVINLALMPDVQSLEEIVVVGYGVEKEANLTGAVSTVNIKNLNSRPATSTASLLQGQMPGVTVTQSSGQPGREGMSILIRGIGTMGNAQPMVIVDGMESSMANINPNDIQNISVLKDASSAAIYGTRAANGVILITTKRGKAGSPEIIYNTYVGRQQATRLPEYLSSAGYARLLNEGHINAGQNPRYTEEEIRKFETGEDPYNYPNTDWYDLLLQGSGFTQNHNLRFSGGDSTSRYNVSFGYNEQLGLIENTNSERYNVRVNLDSKINNWFDIGLNAGLSRKNIVSPLQGAEAQSGGMTRFFDAVNKIPPTFLNKYEDGQWAGEHPSGNPNAWIEAGNKTTANISQAVGMVFMEAKLLKGLSLRGQAGVDYIFDESKDHVASFTYGSGRYSGPNSVSESLIRNSVTDLTTLLRYANRLGRHEIRGLLGISRRSELFRSTGAYRREFPSNQLTVIDAGSPVGMSNSGTDSESTLGSYFGRINYNYDNKYLLEANLRRDGSSKFASGKRWGWFPSFSAGWIMTEEPFLADIGWLDFLKLRVSWGTLGNHRINNFIYLPLINLGQDYTFGGEVAPGAAQTTANNPNISWETTTETNFGLDLELFSSLISIRADYYQRYTDDILTVVPVSETFGLPAPTVNAGAMSNNGVELQVSHFNSINDFQYNITLNSSFNKNRVERLANPTIGQAIRIEGEAWDSFYGYEWIGYFQSDEEALNNPVHHPNVRAGDLKFKDQNDDGIIDGDDRIVLGNPTPEVTYGINLGLAYKGFDFSTFIQGVDGIYRRLMPRILWPFQIGGKAEKMHLDRVIVENGQVVQQGHFPRTLIGGMHNEAFSSFGVHDAAYIRLKNIQLGYTFPSSWTDAIAISRARIYFSGENLFTFARNFPGNYDPETNPGDFLGVPGGQGGLSYPQVKFYMLGLDINF